MLRARRLDSLFDVKSSSLCLQIHKKKKWSLMVSDNGASKFHGVGTGILTFFPSQPFGWDLVSLKANNQHEPLVQPDFFRLPSYSCI